MHDQEFLSKTDKRKIATIQQYAQFRPFKKIPLSLLNMKYITWFLWILITMVLITLSHLNDHNQCEIAPRYHKEVVLKENRYGIAVLILVHDGSTAKGATRIIQVMNHPNVHIVVHIDRKIKNEDVKVLYDYLKENPSLDVHIMSNHFGKWGHISLVQMTLDGIYYFMQHENLHSSFTHFLLLSGNSHPMRNTTYILDFFKSVEGKSILSIGGHKIWPYKSVVDVKKKRFNITNLDQEVMGLSTVYFGSQWVVLSHDYCKWIVNSHLTLHMLVYMSKASVPDESYFQTLIMHSPLNNTLIPYDLHYEKWRNCTFGKRTPCVLSSQDITEIREKRPKVLFARKIDPTVDTTILTTLESVIAA